MTPPAHVAIIMDGNGRWARKQGAVRLVGHKFGVGSVRRVTEAAWKLGVRYLTLYVFSTENWSRPADEVQGLMGLLGSTIEAELSDLMRNNVRLLTLGDGELPAPLAAKMRSAVERTAHNTGLTLTLALSYSGRWEIAEAARDIARRVAAGELDPESVDQQTVARSLPSARLGLPDPELLIRTSGELRISNFLLYQIAYTELYFTDTLWPDFGEAELRRAIESYQHRERRFGLTEEQLPGTAAASVGGSPGEHSQQSGSDDTPPLATPDHNA